MWILQYYAVFICVFLKYLILILLHCHCLCNSVCSYEFLYLVEFSHVILCCLKKCVFINYLITQTLRSERYEIINFLFHCCKDLLLQNFVMYSAYHVFSLWIILRICNVWFYQSNQQIPSQIVKLCDQCICLPCYGARVRKIPGKSWKFVLVRAMMVTH